MKGETAPQCCDFWKFFTFLDTGLFFKVFIQKACIGIEVKKLILVKMSACKG
jgi:hypothetical protein